MHEESAPSYGTYSKACNNFHVIQGEKSLVRDDRAVAFLRRADDADIGQSTDTIRYRTVAGNVLCEA